MNAQLRKVQAYPCIKPHDSLEIVSYSQIVSGCVNVLSHFGYESDNNSVSATSSAVRKLPRELQNKRMTYVLRGDSINKTMRVFSAWPKEIARVQDNLRWQLGSRNDKAKTTSNRDKPKLTSFAATSDSGSSMKTQCPLKDGEHKIRESEKFERNKIAERHEAVRKCNLCFSCPGSGHRIVQCKANRTCGKDGCSKRPNNLLHSDDKKPDNQRENHNKVETANNADAVFTANSYSGILQIVPITLSSANKSIETMAICDSGSTLSFVDKSLSDQLDVPGNSITLNIAGINKTKEMVSEKVRIKVPIPCVSESVMFHVHHSMYPANKSYDYNDLKRRCSLLDVLPDDILDLKQVKVVLGQDNYHFFPCCIQERQKKEPWAVKTKLGWSLSGPIPKHEVAQAASTSNVNA